MAGDWIKMRSNLDTNPHVIGIAAELGIAELYVVGLLWKVWSWADTHTIDGNAIRVTNVTLDRFTGVTGFASALRKVGWLEGEDNALTFPRFAEHNGQTAKNRAETAFRVAKHRNAKTVTDVTQKPLPEKRREEKRREEAKEHTSRDDAGAFEGQPTSKQTPAYSAAFEEWYAAYPRHEGKAAAATAYGRKLPTVALNRGASREDAHKWLVEVTRVFAASLSGQAGKFTPHPATWLNEGRYDDDQTEWSKNGSDTNGSKRAHAVGPGQRWDGT